MTEYPIRPIRPDELPAFRAVHEHSFNAAPQPPSAQERTARVIEYDRTLAAFDGPAIVGKTGAFSFQMAVPGSLVPVAGVSMVGVLPSHRRRGILSALMRRQLADIHEHGEAVAALFASEANIYGRYGYGRASWHAAFRIFRGETALARGAPVDRGLRMRITEPQAALPDLAKIYEVAMVRRPGMFARSDAWWDRVIADPEEHRGGACPLRCVIAEDEAGPRGYALFSARERWDEDAFLPDGKMEIREVIAADPAATAAVWSDLLTRDLVSEFYAEMQPVDDPLLHLLADPRRLRLRVADSLWARVVDVGEALSQRRYSAPVDVVIEVADDVCPWNQGRWRLTAAPASPARAAGPGFAGVCQRTSDPADLTLPAHALGSAFLGGGRLGPMADAGLVGEQRPGAIAALSAAMSWDPAPWCPTIF